MNRQIKLPARWAFTGLLCLILAVGPLPTAFAATGAASACDGPLASQLVLNSHSFTAQKKSSFSVGGQKEQVGRGLTVIHFNSSEKFEFRTFDTHGSTEAATQLVFTLDSLQMNKAVFALLVHDSAAKSLSDAAKTLTEMGFPQLGGLQSRQAYLMHNFGGTIYEKVNDTTLDESFTLPSGIKDASIYFPKIRYKFEPNNNRYIAHAGGEVNGIKSTNTKDALDQNYAKGFRLFELDIIETADGKLVAAHDWGMWSRFTDFPGSLPPTHAQFMKEKIYGDYTTLDMDGINEWFAAHPDATLVTDKVNDPIAFAEAFVDQDRLIMELFSVMAVEEASQQGIKVMISQEPFMHIVGNKINFLKVNNIEHVAVSRRIIDSQTELLLQLRDQGIKVYVYNVNFDPGKDEEYVLENEIGLVYGMYADKWVFDQEMPKRSK